jgi:hypothetical protein
MITEMSSARLAALRQAPIQIDTWTSTPAPDRRINRWELYREAEVKRLITSVEEGKNIVISGREQAGKSTMMVESYFALLAGGTPTYGFSTRVLLPELPFDNGANQAKIMASLENIPKGQVVMVDNVDYLFRTFESMSLHPQDGGNYMNANDKDIFRGNCSAIFNRLITGQFTLIFSLHNDWQPEWVDHNRHQMWLNSLGTNFDSIELNTCIEPTKALTFLTMERGMDLSGLDHNHLAQVLGNVPFGDLKRKSAVELLRLFKS